MDKLQMTSAAAQDARLRTIVARAQAADDAASALHDIYQQAWPTRADGYAKGMTLQAIQQIANRAIDPAQALRDVALLASQFSSRPEDRLATLAALVSGTAASAPQRMQDARIVADFDRTLFQETGARDAAAQADRLVH